MNPARLFNQGPAGFQELAKSVEGLNLELIQGEVFMVYPGLGVYLVLPKHGEKTGDLSLCCSMQGGMGRSGARGGDIYEAGDEVLYARQRYSTTPNLAAGVMSDLGYILCAAPPDFMATAQGYPGANIHGEELDFFNQLMTEAFASTKKLTATLRDVSFGMPNDVFSGDYVKYSPLYTFFSVCASKTSIGASPMAMVEAFAFHDKVRIQARTHEVRSLAVESGWEPDEKAMMYYRRLAMTEREGMGAVGDVAPFIENADGQIENAGGDGQLGVFRHSELAGPIADGDLTALARPAEETGVHTTDELPPIGKVSVRRTYDGRHETRASGGIDHVKSLYIPVPEQTRPHDGDAFDSTPEPQEAYERAIADQLGGDFSPFSAVLESQEFDADTANNRNSIAKSRSDYWRVMTREQLAEKYPNLNVKDAPVSLDRLSPSKQFYDRPPVVDETDPVTNLKRRIYALESIIRQQPDGSIVISDGHGSEIRMYRGRISISPAVDLELRPGRDCFEFVPRRKVTNAGKEIQLNSNEGKIRIKAETDLDLLAANGETGRLLIESRAAGGTAENSGITVRSKAQLNLMGVNMYMGLTPPEEGSKTGLSRNRADGNIIIDSRGGLVGLQGNALYGHFEGGVSFSSNGAVFALAGGIMTGVCNTFNVGTGIFKLSTPLESGITRTLLAERGIDTINISSPSAPRMQIDGSIDMSGGITAKGTVRATNAIALSGAFGNGSDTSGVQWKNARAPQVKIDRFSVKNISVLARSFTAAVPSDLTDAELMKAWFGYDKPEQVQQTEYQLQAMRWQAMLMNGGEPEKWTQKAVTNKDGEATYAYPGYGPKKTPLNAGLVGMKAFDEYIVNR